MEELIPVGRIARSHGLKGELKVSIDEPYLADFRRAQVLFLTRSGKPLPHFVEYIRGKATPILKLEGIDNREMALLLHKSEVALRPADITVEVSETEAESLEHLVGFTIIDQTQGTLGTIDAIFDLPQHYLASLTYQGKEIFVPLHDHLITSVDPEQEELHVDLPEGLLEL